MIRKLTYMLMAVAIAAPLSRPNDGSLVFGSLIRVSERLMK
jgi:hypothetical protein